VAGGVRRTRFLPRAMQDANTYHKLGINHFRAGHLDDAAQAFDEALAAVEAEDDRHKEAEILNDLGVTRRELGEWDQAEAALAKADVLFTSLGDVKGQAQVAGNLGSVLEGSQRYEEAAEAYRRSARMFEDIGESDLAMYAWQALSRLHMKHKQWLPAIAAYEEGIENMPDGSPKKGLLRRIVRMPGRWLLGR